MTCALLPRAERRVGRLRVRAREEGEARHASILLADALRMASLPIADQGQMLVVRKLSLGRISSFASSATLALQLELAMREARLSAVHFASPAAENANAVIFPGPVEALAALARLHACRIEPKEWFWKAVVTKWAARSSRAERWLALIEAAHCLPEAAIASAHVLEEALRAGVEEELLSSIQPGQGAVWLRLEGWHWSAAAEPPMNNIAAAGPEPNRRAPSTRHQEVIDRWETRWGPSTERLIWLATILAVTENPARASDPRLAIAMTRRLAFSPATRKARERAASEHGPDVSGETQGSSSAKTKPATQSAEAAVRNILTQAGASMHLNANAKPVVGNYGDETSTNVEKNEVHRFSWEPTSFAGLLFLAPILERLGFAEFIAANPSLLEDGFPSRLLCFVGARVGMLQSDPLALALNPPIESEPVFPQADLPKAAREILLFPAPRAYLDSPLVAWTTALRRWSRRYARLGLRSLIHRPGRVAISRTQLDIFFDLEAVDLRLRRVALDADPGWIPWLGRVVRFHYLEAHEYDL